MRKVIGFLTLIFMAYAVVPVAFAGEYARLIEGVPSYVQSPDALARWLEGDFEYQLKIPDRPQAPQETVNRKTGDCDDFAALASTVLSAIGVRNDVIVIKFKGLNIRHAICIWKDKDGAYSFISSRELIHTTKRTIEDAVKYVYPDYEKITVSNL